MEGRQRAWSAYWASGRKHSCAGRSTDGYGKAIGAFWRSRVADLRPGQAMLDLASGNGALPELVWAAFPDGSVRVDAVDLAQVEPWWFDRHIHRGVHFHPGVAMESLPFTDASYDRVFSQFGLEYSDLGRALPEVARVCRPGAEMAFVMHHAGSVLVRVGREEAAHHRLLRQDAGLLQSARDIIPWMAHMRLGGTAGNAATTARERYNIAMRGVAEAMAVASAPDLLIEVRDSVHQMVAESARDSAGALQRLDRYVADLDDGLLRLTEMLSHALGHADVQALADSLQSLLPGARLEWSELLQKEGVVAWAMVAGLRE